MSRNVETGRRTTVRRHSMAARDDAVVRDHYQQQHRQLLLEIFSQNRRHMRHVDGASQRSIDLEDSEKESQSRDTQDDSSDEDELHSEDYCWAWDESSKSSDAILQNHNTEVYFHPDYSCGTAAVRGEHALKEGEEHYWEVKLSSAVYGTDMMIGVGSATVDLNKYKSQFCSIIGKEANSWGVSYFGTLHHNGKTSDYTKKFERGSVIGCHLDLWKGTLSFYKNGQPLGIAFDGLLGKQLYPMISSTAARTRMKLLRSHKTPFSLQYLCCREISANMPSTPEALSELPLPKGLKRYIGWRMDWVFKLNNPSHAACSALTPSDLPPSRKRVRRRKKKFGDTNVLRRPTIEDIDLDDIQLDSK